MTASTMTTGSDSDSSPDAEASPRAASASTLSLQPGAARRRELRLQRRAERWRNLWRLLVFSGLSAGLATVLLRQGWILQSPSQVEVSGSRIVSREQVIQAGRLTFPLPLLAVRPRELRSTLSAALPVEQVRVSRWMLPPRLRVELVDRQAVARAQRRRADAGGTQGRRAAHWAVTCSCGAALTTRSPAAFRVRTPARCAARAGGARRRAR